MVSKRLANEEGHRRKLLVIVDDSSECDRAVTFAALRAEKSNGLLDMLHVIAPGDFQHWLGVEEIMKAEAREEAEQVLARYAARAQSVANVTVETVIKEGLLREEIDKLIEEDKDISLLVLAAGGGKDGPGPLVSSIAGRGNAFPIPVTVVPFDITDEELVALA
jgi:nucleotide-binding universal stress UspA family protein